MFVLSGQTPMSNRNWKSWEPKAILLLKSKILIVFKLAAKHAGSGVHSKNSLFALIIISLTTEIHLINSVYHWWLLFISCMWTHGCWRQFLPWICRWLHEQIGRRNTSKATASTSHQLVSHPHGRLLSHPHFTSTGSRLNFLKVHVEEPHIYVCFFTPYLAIHPWEWVGICHYTWV